MKNRVSLFFGFWGGGGEREWGQAGGEQKDPYLCVYIQFLYLQQAVWPSFKLCCFLPFC